MVIWEVKVSRRVPGRVRGWHCHCSPACPSPGCGSAWLSSTVRPAAGTDKASLETCLGFWALEPELFLTRRKAGGGDGTRAEDVAQ